MAIRIHPTAEVSPRATIGDGTSIWHLVQIREDVQIGANCILSKGVYLDVFVTSAVGEFEKMVKSRCPHSFTGG